MIFTASPGCRGCIYLDIDGLCAHAQRAGISKLKLGVKTGKTGGCALYQGNKGGQYGKSPTDYDQRVTDLYHEGCSDVEISQKTGFTQNQIYCWRKRHRLPSHGKPGRKKKIVS